MNKISLSLSCVLVSVSLALTGTASAADNKWFVEPEQQVGSLTTTVDRGDPVSVMAVVDAKGAFTAPKGWNTQFNPEPDDKCLGMGRPAGCGTWVAVGRPGKDMSPTFGHTNSTTDTKVVVIKVRQPAPPPPAPQPVINPPPGGWYPATSGSALETRVTDLEKGKESVRLFMHYGLVPNLETTTAVGHGLILGVSALVVDSGPAARFSIGGKFAYSRSRIPIDLSLRPVITEGSEDRYTGAFTLGWTPCMQLKDEGVKRDFWCFSVGALTGFQVYSYDQTFNRGVRNGGQLENVEFIRERTQYSFMLGPELSTSVHITRNFGLGLGFSLPIDVTNVSRTIGEGSNEAKGSVQANPTFHGGVEFFF